MLSMFQNARDDDDAGADADVCRDDVDGLRRGRFPLGNFPTLDAARDVQLNFKSISKEKNKRKALIKRQADSCWVRAVVKFNNFRFSIYFSFLFFFVATRGSYLCHCHTRLCHLAVAKLTEL